MGDVSDLVGRPSRRGDGSRPRPALVCIPSQMGFGFGFGSAGRLNAPDDLRLLGVELCGICLVSLLLALIPAEKRVSKCYQQNKIVVIARDRGCAYVFQALALVVFQQPVLATVVSTAKGAVADDPLRCFPALLEGAPDLLGSHFRERV